MKFTLSGGGAISGEVQDAKSDRLMFCELGFLGYGVQGFRFVGSRVRL